LSLAAVYANGYETEPALRGFAWGTSMEAVVAGMGQPVSREEVDGFVSLLWENVEMGGFLAFMLAYFSPAGLQGGVFYFRTYTMDETMRCYADLQRELLQRYGPTRILDTITRELRPYATSWNLAGGMVRLRVNTREWEPVTLWYSSPELTAHVFGNR